ncbi:MAG: hypothetical protein EBU66_13100 [Bacteroidetes bacterium]|nr:hypothetical protein [bacterium]NBP65583.1 hypothetical protein [Bacteroidota bacterium]
MTTNIYVLKLQGGNYYVGKSDDVIGRFKEHMNGKGSAWTRKYKPISIVQSKDGVSAFEEDKMTKEYMSKYGVDKVRGGSYVTEVLSDSQLDTLNTEIWMAKDCCTQCGRKGHFVKDCRASTDVSGNRIEYDEDYADEYGCEYCDRTFTTAFGCGVHEKSCKDKVAVKQIKKGTCYRCGRKDHYSTTCYARTDSEGCELDSESDSDSGSDYDSD